MSESTRQAVQLPAAGASAELVRGARSLRGSVELATSELELLRSRLCTEVESVQPRGTQCSPIELLERLDSAKLLLAELSKERDELLAEKIRVAESVRRLFQANGRTVRRLERRQGMPLTRCGPDELEPIQCSVDEWVAASASH